MTFEKESKQIIGVDIANGKETTVKSHYEKDVLVVDSIEQKDFEEEFPSLKGKANYVMTPQCPRAVELVGNPSEEVRLAWQGKQVVITELIEKYCLDKQKVREAIATMVLSIKAPDEVLVSCERYLNERLGI